MGSLSVADALQLPVRLQGIELGRPVDLLLETDTWRALGFVVRCRDESQRFLPYMASQPGDEEIAVGSALMLLDDVAFYEKRGVSFRSLIDGAVDGGVLRDVIVSRDGDVSELALHGDERVLDVGTGSGYQAAVLAELASEVHTIERIPELAEQARERLEAAGYGDRVHVHVGDGTRGLPEHAPFDAIAVAAAAPEIPMSLYEQLKMRGRLVVPVGNRYEQLLQLVVRTPEGAAVVHSVPCRFVPLLGEEGFDGR